ncbi:MAG: alpha-galactosidase [Clostridia bacterium]|nr:alpha-galactosidase [Clostridia bacterium]
MNIFENVRVWYKTEEGGKTYLDRVSDGVYSDGDVEVRLSEKKQCQLTALYVDASKKDWWFHPDYAVGLSISGLDNMKRYVANFMNCNYWCRTQFDSDLKALHVDTQGLIYEKNDGNFNLVLPVCDAVYKTTLFGDEDGMNVGISSYYHKLSKVENTLALVVNEGDGDPYHLVREAAEYAFELLSTGLHTRDYRRYPDVFNYLGWCTWDSMYIDVSAEGILQKCEEFKEKNIPVRWAIIDDIWAYCRGLNVRPYVTGNMFRHQYRCGLSSVEADPERFPNGLKSLVDEVAKYGIKTAVWHAAAGYWNGIDPESDLARELADCLTTLPNGKLVPRFDSEANAYKFFSKIHRQLRADGVDFVKVDNQSLIRRHYANVAPVGTVARNMHAGLEASVGESFDGTIMNCMCMASENMWNRSKSALARCSGDFLPENREWFKTHIMQCVYSAMFQGEFYWTDYDMWWTDDGQAGKNSLLRAISGGPVYVSDKIGRSNAELLRPLAFADGRIPRPDKPARPTFDCLFTDPAATTTPLKIFNTCSGGKYGVIAAYNLNSKNRRVHGTISPDDVYGLAGEEFAVYEYNTGKIRFLHRGESFRFALSDHDDYRLYIISPIDENGIAMLGRIDKFMAPAAITDSFSSTYSVYEGGKIAFIHRGRKSFTAQSESGKYAVERNGSLCTFTLPESDRHFTLI